MRTKILGTVIGIGFLASILYVVHKVRETARKLAIATNDRQRLIVKKVIKS